jgi:hypothetical protein
MEQITLIKALQILPRNGALYEIKSPSADGHENSVYSLLESYRLLARFDYVEITETEAQRVAVAITNAGKSKLAKLE